MSADPPSDLDLHCTRAYQLLALIRERPNFSLRLSEEQKEAITWVTENFPRE